MNKRILQGILIVGVLVVWGLVIYRLVSGRSADGDINIHEAAYGIHAREELNYQDSLLFLTYRDPFLDNQNFITSPTEKKVPAKQSTPSKKQQTETPKAAQPWPEIVYQGLINNKSRNSQLLAMLIVNGKEHIVKKGEQISGYEVISISPGEISLKSPEKEIKAFSR